MTTLRSVPGPEAADLSRVSRVLVRQAYLDACRAELQALKPGNVHVFADGHGMTVADFEASAEASADAMADPQLAVGARIWRAVRRSRDVADCNTNLGIVLLCAPLAEAAFRGGAGSLRERLLVVLDGLRRTDADFAFRAIRLANPGGLGDARKHDVRRRANVTLRTAMAEARLRDRIARQYVTGFADVFGFGLPRLALARSRWGEGGWATTAVYLGFLGRFSDSHVRRKFGLAAARALSRQAAGLDRRLLAARSPAALRRDLLRFDTELKLAGLNPGTSADLTVATLFAAALENATIP
jgi:triphosphoribosyl-dephospho-CoA synthase